MTIDKRELASPGAAEQARRELAVQRLRKRRDFHAHLLVYVLVNGLVAGIWAVTGSDGFFWPVFLIAGWGIGLVMNAWDVYGRRDITEREIQREMERLDR